MSASLDAIIVGANWIGSQSLQVEISSHHDDRYHQLYLGRTLIGVTTLPADRLVTGLVVPTKAPSPLQVVAVTADDRFTDYGAQLPERPYNRFRLEWVASGLEADTERFAVLVPTEFAAQPDTLHLCVPSTGDGNYGADLPAVDQSGDWAYAVQPIDDATGDDPITEGNYGEPTELTIRAKVIPPDLVPNSDRTRYTTTVTENTLTIEWAYGWGVS